MAVWHFKILRWSAYFVEEGKPFKPGWEQSFVERTLGWRRPTTWLSQMSNVSVEMWLSWTWDTARGWRSRLPKLRPLKKFSFTRLLLKSKYVTSSGFSFLYKFSPLNHFIVVSMTSVFQPNRITNQKRKTFENLPWRLTTFQNKTDPFKTKTSLKLGKR